MELLVNEQRSYINCSPTESFPKWNLWRREHVEVNTSSVNGLDSSQTQDTLNVI